MSHALVLARPVTSAAANVVCRQGVLFLALGYDPLQPRVGCTHAKQHVKSPQCVTERRVARWRRLSTNVSVAIIARNPLYPDSPPVRAD